MAGHQPRLNLKSTSYYSDFTLSQVCTIQEASMMWRKSRTAIINAIDTGKIQARQSFTGGEYLISVDTMIHRYGKPLDPILFELWEGGGDIHPLLENEGDNN